MKELSLFIAICLFCCNPAFAKGITVNASPSKGIQLFRTGQYEQAYQMLLAQCEKEPGNLELEFYLGRAALESGHNEMAVMVLERILIASPGHDRVKLELARAFYAVGDNNSARRYCREVLAGNPPEAVKENINAFLSKIDQSEQKHFFHGSISLGADWNSNVWSSPSSGTIDTIIGDVILTGPTAQETSDWFLYTALSLDHTYRFLSTPWSWKTNGSFFSGWYDKAHDLDILYGELLTGPQITKGRQKFSLQLLTRQISLDNEKYMDSIGAKAVMDHIFSASAMARVSAAFETENYPDARTMDCDNKLLEADLMVLKYDTWFDFGVGLEQENAHNDEYSYDRLLLRVSAARPLIYGITGSLKYEFKMTDYDAPVALFDDKRKDRRHTLSVGLSRHLWHRAGRPDQNAELRLNYQRIWSHSNIDLYEYAQNLVQTCLVYNF